MKKNGESYFVFELAIRDRMTPTRLVSRRPLTLAQAKDLARIGASEGKHDRAVTTNPRSRSFRIVARYAAGTGEKVTRRMRANCPPTEPVAVAEPEWSPSPLPAIDDQGWRFDPMTGEPLGE